MKLSQVLTAAVLTAVLAVPALAQNPAAVKVKGKIEAADANSITVKTNDGATKVGITDKTKVLTIGKGTLADLKKGSYVGVGAMPQADGSQKAIRVMIFAESQRGTGEGSRPWDKPNTTMTNATVDTTVASVEGQVVTVRYKDGEKKIVIGPEAIIVAFMPGERAELKPGANVAITAVAKGAALEATRITVGRGDIVP